MTIKWRKPPSDFLDDVELERVTKVTSLLKLVSGTAIESYTMSQDGPTVTSVFVINDDYICEIRLTSKDHEFDVSATGTLVNYRVKFGESKSVENADSSNLQNVSGELVQGGISNNVQTRPQLNVLRTIKFVEINIRHTDSLDSKISYFGDDIDDWLSYFLETYPTHHLLK
jgi:hypothetical protein